MTPSRGPLTPKAPMIQRARGGLIFLALLGLITIAVVVAPDIRATLSRSDDDRPDYGYAAIINRIFAPMNWLQVNEPDPELPSTHIVDLTPEAASHPEVIDFYVRSPLLHDISANDERLWRISGRNVIGLDPAARLLPQPFAEGRWSGNIVYGAGSVSVTLYGGRDGQYGRRIEIRPLRVGDLPSSLTPISIADPAPDFAVDQQFLLTDEAGSPLAIIRLIGRHLVVFPIQGAGASLLVDTPAGPRQARYDEESGRRAYEVAQGGSIVVLRDNRAIANFHLGSLSTALSTYRPFAGRTVDPALGSFARDIESSVLASGLVGTDPIRTTLNRDLHQGMQVELERFVAAEFGGARTQPLRAAAMAMDTVTGEVLALASFTKQAAGSVEPTPARSELNNNFATLPIGSVAKVPVSAAILSQFPGLRGLEILGTGDFDHALGIDMDGMQDDGPTGPINFPAFLTRSSNRYATMLMLLALSEDPWQTGSCSSEEYWIGDTSGRGRSSRRFAPLFVLDRSPQPCGDRFAMPVGGALSSKLRSAPGRPNWVSLLGQMFDLPGVENPPPRYDTSLWPQPGAPSEAWERAFRSISPEEESFGLGTIRQFHNDYVNLILGGVHSRWTTIKVAEIYSRVVTGQQIEATLLRRQARGHAPVLAPLDLDARLSILAGLSGVVEDRHGTAHPYLAEGASNLAAPLEVLRSMAALRPSEEIRIYAKTGTPTIARTRIVPTWLALRNLEAQRLLLLIDGELKVAGSRGNEGDLAALRRLPQAAAEARRQGLTLPQLAQGLRDLRIEVGRTEIRGPNNHLALPTTQVLQQPANAPRNNGGVIAIVMGRYCHGAPLGAVPERAITLVINFQVRGSVNPAGAYARRLLQRNSPLVRRLFAQPTRCEAALQ